MAARPQYVTADSAIPLCVDLDGTLIQTDLLWEATARALKQQPWLILLFPLWLMRGRAYLKEQLAARIEIQPAGLPYNRELLDYLSNASDRPLILATASPKRWAEAISDYLGIFSAVYSTSDGRNLKGSEKRKLLDQRLGERAWDYAGNSRDDLAVWVGSRQAILVNASAGVRDRARALAPVAAEFDRAPFSLRTIARALRIHQWSKNALLFVPAALAHHGLGLRTLAGFLAFGLVASAFYILNDLMDLANDRQHPTKQKRPWASGALPLPLGFALIPGLLGVASAILCFLPTSFTLLVLLYAGMTCAYSFYLKRKLFLDVIVLALLYALRILAGGQLAGVWLSPWLLGFSVFFFSSLALAKRTSELFNLKSGTAGGRGYYAADLPALAMMGVSSGYVSAMILALYMNSTEVVQLYHRPQLLWLVCPLVIYWLSRLWIVAWRGQLHEDPIVFALRDRLSYFAGACGISLFLAAM